MAAGDVVNTTARLQSAAPVNGILVGETTYRATAESIEFREHDAIEAKGKEQPVAVWEVVEARARFGVDLAPETRTQLVGREREVDLLVGTLARTRQQRSTELVTLIGVPGIGKSRLVGELFQSIERGGELTYWRQGRSLPYGEGVSYWALGEMVKAQAGILETDNDDEVARSSRARSSSWSTRTRTGCWHTCVRSSVRPATPPDHRTRRSQRGVASSKRSPKIAARPGLRGSAVGRRGLARLRRASRGLGARCPDADPLHRADGVAGATPNVGRREAQRRERRAGALVGGRDGEADCGAERPAAARGRCAGRAPRPRRR